MKREEGELSSDEEDAAGRPPDRRLYDTQRSFDRSFGWLESQHSSHSASYRSESQYQSSQHDRSNSQFVEHESPNDRHQIGQRAGTSRPAGENSYEDFLSGHQRQGRPSHETQWPQAPGRVPTPQAIGGRSRHAEYGRERSPEGWGDKMRFQRPLPLAPNIPTAEKYERWRDWKAGFDVALSITGTNYSQLQKAGLLYTSIGPDTQKIIQLLQLPPQSNKPGGQGHEYGELSQGLNDFFRGMVDESVDHNRFYDSKQTVKESIHEFIFRLRTLAMTIGVEPNSFAFRLQFLKGMRNRELATRAGDENTPLKDIVQAAARREQREAIEASSRQSLFKEMEQSGGSALVARVQEEKRAQGFKRPLSASHETSSTKAKPCNYCGGRQHRSKKECPAFGKSCNSCGKANHYAKVCQQEKKSKTVNSIVTGDPTDDGEVRNETKFEK